MRDKPCRNSHEIPWVCPEVKTKFQFGNSPVRLNRRARIALDGQSIVLESFNRCVVEHDEAMTGESRIGSSVESHILVDRHPVRSAALK